jgi:hypothetical protein
MKVRFTAPCLKPWSIKVKAERQALGKSVHRPETVRPGRAIDPANTQLAEAFLRVAIRGVSVTAFAAKRGIAHTTLLRALRAPDLAKQYQAIKDRRRVSEKPVFYKPLRKHTRQLLVAYLQANAQAAISPTAFAKLHNECHTTLLNALKHPELRRVKSEIKAKLKPRCVDISSLHRALAQQDEATRLLYAWAGQANPSAGPTASPTLQPRRDGLAPARHYRRIVHILER